MMSAAQRSLPLLLVTAIFVSGCSTSPPSWRNRTAPLIDHLGRNDASSLYPLEYRSLLETFEQGEALLHVRKDSKVADQYFRLAYQKGEILKSEVNRTKNQRLSDARAKSDEEKLLRAVEEAEARFKQQQEIPPVVLSAPAEQKKGKETAPPLLLPPSYTVRRGETLPQIAGRIEIYNDSKLWPLIYRANRDQIRDPKRLWPGQVLAIPRNVSRYEAIDARRFSNKND